jgi:hypothetical protein
MLHDLFKKTVKIRMFDKKWTNPNAELSVHNFNTQMDDHDDESNSDDDEEEEAKMIDAAIKTFAVTLCASLFWTLIGLYGATIIFSRIENTIQNYPNENNNNNKRNVDDIIKGGVVLPQSGSENTIKYLDNILVMDLQNKAHHHNKEASENIDYSFIINDSQSNPGSSNKSNKSMMVSWRSACEESVWHYNMGRLCMSTLSVCCIMICSRNACSTESKKTFWHLVYLTLILLPLIGCGVTLIFKPMIVIMMKVQNCILGVYNTAMPWACTLSFVFICCDVSMLLCGTAYAFAHVPLYFLRKNQ